MQVFRKKLTGLKRKSLKKVRAWRKHPAGLPLAIFFGLVGLSAVLLVLANSLRPATFRVDSTHIVIVSTDGQAQTVPTREPTVGALLKKLHIYVTPEDRVEPSVTTQIVQDNFRINVYRAVPVTIVDGATVTTAKSAAATPRSIATNIGTTLYAEDVVTQTPAENLLADRSIGTRITITRSVPVALNVYGTQLPLRTHAKTVGDLLRIKNIKLGPNDVVIPAANTAVTPNVQVFVNRKGTQIVTETQTIPAPVETVLDTSLSFGTTAVRQQGSDGTQVLTYQVQTENGKEISRTLLQTVVTVPAVTKVVARGQAVSIPADKQAVMAQAGIASSDYPYVDYIMSHESGWCPTKLQGQVGYCPGYPPDVIPSGLGYGLGQATPGTKMAGFGDDWKTNPVTQLRWATSYATRRFGSWSAAYDYWQSHHNW